MKNRHSRIVGKQTGFVLASTMMLLVILTLVILSMMRTSTLEERMVGNSRDWNNAFQAAEAALRDAQLDIEKSGRISGLTGFVADCNNQGLCLPNTCPSSSNCSPVWVKIESTDTYWKNGGSGTAVKSLSYGAKTSATALRGLASQPRYIIEALSVSNPPGLKILPGGGAQNSTFYRITAVGFGASNNTRVMLQSMVRQQ